MKPDQHPPKPPRRVYPDELKQEAVQMLLDGHSAPSVARNLGIRHTSLLYRWKAEALGQLQPGDLREVYPVITQLDHEGFPVAAVCQALGVSRAGYYAHVHGEAGSREQEDARLRPLVCQIFWEHKR